MDEHKTVPAEYYEEHGIQDLGHHDLVQELIEASIYYGAIKYEDTEYSNENEIYALRHELMKRLNDDDE